MERLLSVVRKKTLDPQEPFLQQWNKIFVVSCVIAVAADPLFFYIPVFNRQHQCLTTDRPLMIIACILRSFIDIFYLLHIIFEFRTGFLPSSLPEPGSAELIRGLADIAKRYLSSNFTIDILSILPLPQLLVLVITPALKGSFPMKTKKFVKIAVLLQYIPRLLRIYPLYKEVVRTSGILTERAWSGAAFNLLIYLQASHVLGALWYLFSVEQQARCWHEACKKINCTSNFLYCGDPNGQAYLFIDAYCSHKESEGDNAFDFGMYAEAFKFHLTETMSFRRKFIHSFWWALRNVSSSGQNLEVSDYMGEVLFAIFISILGLVLFALLVSNIQKYLQSSNARVEQMRINRRAIENWMRQRMLPKPLRRRIRQFDEYKWQLNRGVKEEEVMNDLPINLKRDIKPLLRLDACLVNLKKVPLFSNIDDRLLDLMHGDLKPVLFTEDSIILLENKPIDMMVFIIKGKLRATSRRNISNYVSKSDVVLEAGDFYGEELIPWAMANHITPHPISTSTIKSLTKVEAFALEANQLRSVVSQFCKQHLPSEQALRHALFTAQMFYSNQWRVWAAYKIQEAWRDYCQIKQRDGRFRDSLAKTVGTSTSSAANLYASIFISHLLQAVEQDRCHQISQHSQMTVLLPPLKPDERDKRDYSILNL
ncbi:cyclic nucleotide-gated ion channel 1-like [Cucumis melo var. makuwa]|uniref:Cyclic nucleotide-gated ion channel 1-like n=1 Tax=Cucumis melo var. makuwa TaxID=1194695 RepID=A0A5D3DBC3_CUCMM|nr:cyclic nucleotide-gated ion channel 1-like [Cucumis melo var. makuwa]